MSSTLLKNCRILDVRAGSVLTGMAILLNGETIARVAPDPELRREAGKFKDCEVRDLDGGLVMPGLIDTHVHLCIVREEDEAATLRGNLKAPETLKVLYGAKHARATLAAGITTVRDMGQGDNLALREAVARGLVPGPRVVACGWLGSTAGHGERMASEWAFGTELRQWDKGVDGPYEIRRRVRQLIGQGVDYIKTYATSDGYAPHPFYPYFRECINYTMEELSALCDEAHAAGRRVAAQGLTAPAGVGNALRAGIDTLEHGLVIDNDDLGFMRDHGVFYVPTLAVTKAMWDVGSEKEMKFLRLEPGEPARLLESQLDSFRRAREMGVRIAFGSDAFRVLAHGRNLIELELRVKAGMTVMEALISATRVSAEALGLEGSVGQVAEGKQADLVVVDPDVLSDISLLTRPGPAMVYKAGKRYDPRFLIRDMASPSRTAEV